MNDILQSKINKVLTCYFEELIGSAKDNNGIVGEYFGELGNDSPRLLCQTRSIFFLIKFYEIFNDDKSLKLAQNIYKNTRQFYQENQRWRMWSDKDDPLDLYGFASLAYAEVLLFQSTGSKEFAQYAEETLNDLVQTILSDEFDLESSLYQNRVSQNPLMHLFESVVFAYQVFQKETYKEVAQKILNVIYKHFYDDELGAIMEVSCIEGMSYWYEPGHLFEWGSLLKIAQELGILHEKMDFIQMVNLAENITQKFDQTVPAKVKIPGNEVESIFRIWASLERVRVHFLLGNSQHANAGLEKVLKDFFDENYLPKEFIDMTEKKVKSTTGYHIINCLQDAISIESSL